MSKPAFDFRKFPILGVSAQTIGESLMEIHERTDHNTTPKDVVNYARPEDSPIHDAFEWDDSIAGEKYRENQARRVMRAVMIVGQIEDEQIPTIQQVEMVERPVEATEDYPDIPAFVSVGNNESGSRYVPTAFAMSDPDLRDKVVEDARRGLLAWRKRWGNLRQVAESELGKVIDAIDEAINVPA